METVTIQQTPSRASGASGILQNLGLSLDDIYAYYHGTTDLEPLITRLEDLRDEISRNIEKLKEHSKGAQMTLKSDR